MIAADYFRRGLRALPVIAIFRGQTADRTLILCRSAWAAGIELVEVPVQSEDSWTAFSAAANAAAAAGRTIGAGTITTVTQLDQAVHAGAAFGVCPGYYPQVAERALELGFPLLPGVATATEVGLAVQAGYSFLKAFPARELGTTWAAAIKGPFPQVRLVATGGVSTGDAAEYLRSGYDAVAIGSALGSEIAVAELLQALKGWPEP
jgi:2-dehydro-3-deoxyphosphogluconate aldolase/(4S)-4-hydroxy-2-oxoglutarate aldolase